MSLKYSLWHTAYTHFCVLTQPRSTYMLMQIVILKRHPAFSTLLAPHLHPLWQCEQQWHHSMREKLSQGETVETQFGEQGGEGRAVPDEQALGCRG